MWVHVCASYKRSPVGFQPGSFEWKSNNPLPSYNLSYKKDFEKLYQVFEQGYISGMQGLLPNRNKYVFLIKGVEYSYNNHEEFGKDVYVNIIFEFDNAKDYSSFKSRYQSLNTNDLSKQIADFIVPDRTNREFALHINGNSFIQFVSEMINDSKAPIQDNSNFEINTISPNTPYDEQLTKLFGVHFEKDGSVYRFPPKKKHILIMNKKAQASSSDVLNLSLKARLKTLISKVRLLVSHNKKLIILVGLIIVILLLAIFLGSRFVSSYGTKIQ